AILAGLVAAGLLAAAAAPLRHAVSRPFAMGGLAPAAARTSLFGDLPLAAAVSAGALALALVLAFRSPRYVPVAIVSLLPAAAACGLCVLVFQDGHLADAIGQRRQGSLETGAVASMLTALACVSAARGAVAILASKSERSLGLAPLGVAEGIADFTVPAAIVATL